MNPQLEGTQDIEGTYVFDLRTSNRCLKLNRFFWHMIGAAYRQKFLDDEDGTLEEAGLNDEEKALVKARDWLGLIQYGANFFVLEKFARVVKKTNMEVYAIMRGETFEEFLATRQVPGAR